MPSGKVLTLVHNAALLTFIALSTQIKTFFHQPVQNNTTGGHAQDAQARLELIIAWRQELKKVAERPLAQLRSSGSAPGIFTLEYMMNSPDSSIDLKEPQEGLARLLQDPELKAPDLLPMVTALSAGMLDIRNNSFNLLDASRKGKRSKLYGVSCGRLRW